MCNTKKPILYTVFFYLLHAIRIDFFVNVKHMPLIFVFNYNTYKYSPQLNKSLLLLLLYKDGNYLCRHEVEGEGDVAESVDYHTK